MNQSITIDLRMYRHSGIGRYLRNLIPPLIPLLEAEVIHTIAHADLLEAEPWQLDPRVRFTTAQAPIYSLGEQRLAFSRALRDTTLLWAPHYNVPLAYRGALAVTLHDLAPLALTETFTNPLKRVLAGYLIRHAARQASAILTVSNFTAQELEERLGISPECITVTYPGLDRDWPDPPPPRVPPGSPSNTPPYLLYVGNVKPNKNLTTLLQAFASVLDRIPHRLVLAGRMLGFGTEDPGVLRQATSLGERVLWTGEIPDDALIQLYAGADALVMPSLYEGFGLPLLEAMQLGCPILSSSAASLPEVAGDAALYFDPRNPEALAECLLRVADRALMDTLSLRGRERAACFSYKLCAVQTAAVLNPLLRSKP